MKIQYFGETDTLYIGLRERPSLESEEISEGVVVDFDASGEVVGIEIEDASKRVDLSTLETSALPPMAAKTA